MISLGAVAFALLSLSQSVIGGTTLWSGSFDYYSTSAAFDTWSWGNQVGEYQWYIHGSQPTSEYLALDAAYKNPADTAETKGLKLTVDSTSTWNGVFQRTELIPQTSTNIGTGHLYYHFSVMHKATNPPISTYEHQVLFFESHFTEFKYGVGPNSTYLEWHVGGVAKYGVPFTAGTWYNFAYDIDFTASTVALWASEGGAALTQVYAPVSASTSTNSADWHLGLLRLTSDTTTEDWYFSGVYVENAPINTAIGSGAGTTSTPNTSTTPTPVSTSTVTSTTTSKPVTSTTTTALPTTTSSAGTVAHYAQCGGIGYSGATACVSPYTCNKVNDYYSQCL